MYIIIAGGGVIGFHIASLLSAEGHEVVVLEQSQEALENIKRQLDVKTIRGNAATPKLLMQAEADRADLVLAVTNTDETNMIACFMAKELGAGTTAARIRNPEYSSHFVAQVKSPLAPRRVIRPKKLGIDVFINPEEEAAKEIMNILSGFYSTPVESFAEGLVQIRKFQVEGEGIINRALGEIEFPRPCVVIAIVREGNVMPPDEKEVIQPEDSIYLASSAEYIDELGKMFSPPKKPAKKVMITGGGQIGYLTAAGLSRRGIRVKLIDDDIARARELAASLENVEVVAGDGSDKEFLIDQGVSSIDAFIAATESDELNILCGLLARNLAVPRSLVVVNKAAYIPLAEAIGVDVAALPAVLTADKITRFVLRGGVISTALIEGEQLEAIEFVTGKTAQIVSKKASDAGLPREAVLVAIVRNNRVIIPPGEEMVLPGDHVIVVSPLSAVSAVEKPFR